MSVFTFNYFYFHVLLKKITVDDIMLFGGDHFHICCHLHMSILIHLCKTHVMSLIHIITMKGNKKSVTYVCN
jgi:hypothetical protein